MDKDIQKEETDGLNLKVLYALDAQWVKIDDLILWAKNNQEINPNTTFHDVARELIKLKNQKPLDEHLVNIG